ncbi:hypothetical protein BC777_0063 [Yoonia maricola]|uniref:Uncharacterized protein n=1 Tax=Yoonia maricola TaxID=420999 RepID=A0A2M8WJZ1_9RHOB|nr:hypothetical protein BC777_0063 [Yoonia maricola]
MQKGGVFPAFFDAVMLVHRVDLMRPPLQLRRATAAYRRAQRSGDTPYQGCCGGSSGSGCPIPLNTHFNGKAQPMPKAT